MTFSLQHAPLTEASLSLGFAGNTVERRSEHRQDDALETALADPATRLLLLQKGRLFVRPGNGTADPWFTSAEADRLSPATTDAVLLGWDAHGPVVAMPAEADPEALPGGIKAIDFRSLYQQGLLGAEGEGALAQAASLISWHDEHRFCSHCGTPSQVRGGGIKRVCPACGAQHFPRTDPVVIMLVVRDEACLLGRSPRFPPERFSTLAGFVEPGETIEAAVRRETLEESGIHVGRVAYHASQPWPFPHSLMIGCYGEALDEAIAFDADELADCRWFTKEETRAMLAGTHPDGLGVPPKGAIAHHLIRHWAES